MSSPVILLLASVIPMQSVAKHDPPINYDPSVSSGQVEVLDTHFSYGQPKRSVPLRIYLPEGDSAAAVVLFSHGLGGSRENSKYLGNHWAGRGYAAVFMQHTGSDREVLRAAARLQKLAAMKAAANGQSARDRFNDVKATIDHLELLNQPGGRHADQFQVDKIGMCGHSFGAVTTQAVSGQSFGARGQVFTDDRIRAAVAFSPSPPANGTRINSFSQVGIPWLLMTGTLDGSPIVQRTDADARRLVFKQLPPDGHFYEVVFDGAKHSAFSDRDLGAKETRNPKHHPAIQAISTAFWDTYLKQDAQAKRWLAGDGPRQLLDSADVWQTK